MLLEMHHKSQMELPSGGSITRFFPFRGGLGDIVSICIGTLQRYLPFPLDPADPVGFCRHILMEEYLYSAYISRSAQSWITQFYLQIHHACLFFVSVHQMAPPLTEVRDIQLQLTTHLSTPKG